MSKGQEFNNRSQGQRIRRTNERVDRLIEDLRQQKEQGAQYGRDIKVMKARPSATEQERKQSRR